MNVLVDINHPDSEQTFKLCRLLGNDLADALPVRLWAYALRTQNRRGLVCATPTQIASIVRWTGDADLLVRALTEADFLEPENGGFRIKGWDRNERYFSERDRLRKMREAQKRTQKRRVRDADKTEHSSSYSSSSQGSKDPREGERARTREAPPPPSDSLLDISASQVSADRAQRLCEEYRTAMKQEHGSDQPLIPPPKRMHEAKLVIAMAGGDDVLAAAIVWAFVRSPGNRGYWNDRKHAFHLLTDHRDFEHAQQLAAGGSNARDEEDPIAAGMRRAVEAEAAKRGGP